MEATERGETSNCRGATRECHDGAPVGSEPRSRGHRGVYLAVKNRDLQRRIGSYGRPPSFLVSRCVNPASVLNYSHALNDTESRISRNVAQSPGRKLMITTRCCRQVRHRPRERERERAVSFIRLHAKRSNDTSKPRLFRDAQVAVRPAACVRYLVARFSLNHVVRRTIKIGESPV